MVRAEREKLQLQPHSHFWLKIECWLIVTWMRRTFIFSAQPEIIHQEDFFGGKKAVIDHDKCSLCGICKENCRYSAISDNFVVDHTACEGCALCHYLCPESAITMEETLNGKWFISNTRFGPMVHANLIPGEENSGKLVALVRNQAKLIAEERNMDIVIVDGAPGVGCPVISSITGVDHVVSSHGTDYVRIA